jgi:phosphatidylglycerophosphatase C
VADPEAIDRVVRENPAQVVVAAFDVDHTLTVRDCVVPFLRRVAGPNRLARRLAAHSHLVVPAAARRDRDALKAIVTSVALRGRHIDEVRDAGRRFGADVARAWLRPDTVARLAWHRRQGHLVALVSASFEVYLDVVGEHLGVDAVLATRLAVDDEGRCTGELVGANCRGAEKVHRLHAWLDESHGGRAAVVLWAYGDSNGDRELLADADHPVRVGRPLVSVAPA